jgi:hypothetical protein
MLVEPPTDLSSVAHRYKNDKREDLNPQQVKRNAYILCIVYRSINAALVDYKQRMCQDDPTTSYAKTLSYRG